MSVRVPVWTPSFDEVMSGRPASAAEKALLEACRDDGWGWAGDACPEDTSDPDRAVRAGLIRFLLQGGNKKHRPNPAGVWLHGAWIEGALDFQGCETHLDLGLVHCLLPEPPVFCDAQIGGLYLSGSRAPGGCDLQRIVVETNVFLDKGFHATGTVDLAGARIAGQLACADGRFVHPDGVALKASGAMVGASVVLRGGFHARGEVNLVGAAITRQLDCTDGRFERPEGVALNASGATVGASVFLSGKFHATGEVNLVGAAITRQLACVDGRFERPEGVALNADAATVGANVLLRGEFHATGEVNLVRATITGQLDCTDGRFERPDGLALNAAAATVGADMFLRGKFHATGEVNLGGAAITGQLDCTDGRFERPGGAALNADAATVGADVFLTGRFQAEGVVNLRRARVEGHLQVWGARIDGAVSLHSARVGAGFFLREIEGEIAGMDLTAAKVGVLHDDAQSWGRVTEGLKLDGFRYESIQSDMTLEERLTWLARCRGQLLPGAKEEIAKEAPYLAGAGAREFLPQPYTLLAHVLSAQGRRLAAARVLFERERRLRETEWLRAQAKLDGSWTPAFKSVPSDLRRFADACFRLLFGYGHRPWRALVWVLGYWAVATWFFGAIYTAGEFAPNSDVILTSADWHRAVDLGCPLAGEAGFAAATAAGCVMPQEIWTSGLPGAAPPVPASTAAGDYETFSAGLYAADLFLPLDTIGQTEAWAPSKDRGTWGWLGYWARFPIQLFGWIMVAMAAAVLTGVVGKKEE